MITALMIKISLVDAVGEVDGDRGNKNQQPR